MDRMPRKLLTGWVEHARPVGCSQMTWGRTLNKALKSYDVPTDFGQWSALTADRRVWQQRIGVRTPARSCLPASSNDFETRQMARAFRRPHHYASISSFKNKNILPMLSPGIIEL